MEQTIHSLAFLKKLYMEGACITQQVSSRWTLRDAKLSQSRAIKAKFPCNKKRLKSAPEKTPTSSAPFPLFHFNSKCIFCLQNKRNGWRFRSAQTKSLRNWVMERVMQYHLCNAVPLLACFTAIRPLFTSNGPCFNDCFSSHCVEMTTRTNERHSYLSWVIECKEVASRYRIEDGERKVGWSCRFY